MDLLKIEKLLEPFGFSLGQLQDIVTLVTSLKVNNYPFDDFISFVEDEKIEAMRERKEAQSAFRRCPICEAAMWREQVNISLSTVTGDESKISYTCTNRECLHQIFE